MDEIVEFLNICHDGAIVRHQFEPGTLTLDIEIEYLTERLPGAPEFLRFRIFDVSDPRFETWPRQEHAPRRILTDPDDIFAFEPDVLDARRDGDLIKVALHVGPTIADHSGGNLSFRAAGIEVYIEGRERIGVEELGSVCREYWEEWSTSAGGDGAEPQPET